MMMMMQTAETGSQNVAYVMVTKCDAKSAVRQLW